VGRIRGFSAAFIGISPQYLFSFNHLNTRNKSIKQDPKFTNLAYTKIWLGARSSLGQVKNFNPPIPSKTKDGTKKSRNPAPLIIGFIPLKTFRLVLLPQSVKNHYAGLVRSN